MKRVLISKVRLRRRFVRDVLGPHFYGLQVFFCPTLVVTKRVKNGANFKGGVSSWQKVFGDLGRLLRDTNAAAITTMLDYYGLPSDFPGMSSRPPGSARSRAEHVEAAMAAVVGDVRFIPYLSLHEFEALVLASLDRAIGVFDDDSFAITTLKQQLEHFSTAEDVNEQPATAPSRRIASAFPSYQKVLHGPIAVKSAGIQILQTSCPHFGSWLTRLEAL